MKDYRHLRGSAQRQGGAILLFAAIGISLLIAILALADIGFLYYYKREYQKAADLAAMAGARGLAESLGSGGANACGAANNAAQANKTQNLGDKGTMPAVTCGVWKPSYATPPNGCSSAPDLRLVTPGSGEMPNAVRAYISGTPPHFLLPPTVISACAIATAQTPLARLTIRNKLLNLDSANSALLNGLVGGLLGGSVNLSAASWQGLVGTEVDLLRYLDALGDIVGLNLAAGGYQQLIGTNVSLLTAIDAAISAVGQNSLAGTSLGLLRSQILSLPLVQNQSISVGQLLGLDIATPRSALDLGLNVFDLLMASVQIANDDHAVYASLPLNLPGGNNVNVRVTVVEGPQLSDIGNPAIDHISVKTAQLRIYVSVQLALLNGLNTVVNAVLNAVGPVTNVVNQLLSLHLVDVLHGLGTVLLGCGQGWIPCPESQALYIKVLPNQALDLSVDVGRATATVTGYSCQASGAEEKSLNVSATSAVAGLNLGKFANRNVNDPSSDFYKVTPQVSPVDLLQIGEITMRNEGCTLLGICWGREYKKGSAWVTDRDAADMAVKLGVRVGITNAPVLGGTAVAQRFVAPSDAELPNISGVQDPTQAQIYKNIPAGPLVTSLKNTLNALTLDVYRTTTHWGGVEIVGAVLNAVLNTLVQQILAPLVSFLGTALLDPLLTIITGALGLDLASAEDAANLTCNAGATLVD